MSLTVSGNRILYLWKKNQFTKQNKQVIFYLYHWPLDLAGVVAEVVNTAYFNECLRYSGDWVIIHFMYFYV